MSDSGWKLSTLAQHAVGHAMGYALWTAIAALAILGFAQLPLVKSWIFEVCFYVGAIAFREVPVPLWGIIALLVLLLIRAMSARRSMQQDSLQAPISSGTPEPAAEVIFSEDEDAVMSYLGFCDGAAQNALQISRQVKLAKLRVEEAVHTLKKKGLVSVMTGGMGGTVVYLSDAGRRVVLEKGYVR